jgi:RNA polymerase sigma-70 factor (ECF subfamily)
MVLSVSQTTRISLLVRLRSDPGDQSAWGAFVARYGPQIHAWCRGRDLQEADAEDVTQMVLLKVLRVLPQFEYDPKRSFRGWLRVLTRNAHNDLLSDQARLGAGPSNERVASLLQSVEAWEDLASRLETLYDLELLEIAMERVRERVADHTWEAFRLTALEHVPAPDAAAQLGLGVGVVYRARSVVQGMLREEVRTLDPEAPP